MKDLMESEKRGIRDKAKAELEELVLDYNNIVESQRVIRFRTAYKICEKIYFIVLKPYLIGKDIEPSDLKIDMRKGKAALKYIGYDFDEKLLKTLFNSKNPGDGKTAKTLFEQLSTKTSTAKMFERAEKELAEREDELFSYINEFLKEIRDHDQVQ